jgi:hypothetical protein
LFSNHDQVNDKPTSATATTLALRVDYNRSITGIADVIITTTPPTPQRNSRGHQMLIHSLATWLMKANNSFINIRIRLRKDKPLTFQSTVVAFTPSDLKLTCNFTFHP